MINIANKGAAISKITVLDMLFMPPLLILLEEAVFGLEFVRLKRFNNFIFVKHTVFRSSF